MGEKEGTEGRKAGFIQQSLAGFFAGRINQTDLSIISDGSDGSSSGRRARDLPSFLPFPQIFTVNFLRVFVVFFVGSL